MIFILPGLSRENIDKFITYKNMDLLDRSLEQGKGVLIPGLHIGNLAHFIAALVYHPKKYEIAQVF